MPLQELEHILSSVPLLARPLLEPHLLELEAKLRPGTLYLTWASMNIDGYLHYAQKVLQRLSFLTPRCPASPCAAPVMTQATCTMRHRSYFCYEDTQVGSCTAVEVQGIAIHHEE